MYLTVQLFTNLNQGTEPNDYDMAEGSIARASHAGGMLKSLSSRMNTAATPQNNMIITLL